MARSSGKQTAFKSADLVKPGAQSRLGVAREPVKGSAAERYRKAAVPSIVEDSRLTAPSAASQSPHAAVTLGPATRPKIRTQPETQNPTRTEVEGTLRQKPTRSGQKRTATNLAPWAVRSVLVVALVCILGFALREKLNQGGHDENINSLSDTGVTAAAPSQTAYARPGAVSQPDQVGSTLHERVEFHREELGRRLNRERLNVQYQNTVSAPGLPEHLKKTSDSEMLRGLPLSGEQFNRERSRDRSDAANPNYADTTIESSLQEQQRVNEFEKAEQKQYIDEFIANAARAGYKVKVDQQGNAVVVGRYPSAAKASQRRADQSQDSESSADGGSVK